ncbi:MAG TPA: hypothetical protein VGG19_03690 [Tepidisphaeraceae bacterium]|jgi:hypothetical protein
MRKLNRLAILTLALMGLGISTANAQVMQQAPSDGLVVAKINNLKSLSDKIAGLAQRFGIAPFVPQLADPLSSVEQDLKITQGINPNGDAAIVQLDPDKYGQQVSQFGVILLPVSDYKAFLGNFSRPTESSDKPAADNAAPTTQAAPAPDAQGIAAIAFPNAFDTAYVAQWGNYAAISKVKSVLATPGKGITASGLAAKELQDKDFIIFLNIPAVREKAITYLKNNRDSAVESWNQIMAHNPNNAAMRPMFTALIQSLIDDAQRIMEDGQAATYGISIGQTGIRTTILGEFDPNSPIGQQVAQVKNSDQSLLTGLPEAKYLFFGGVAWDPKTAGDVVQKVTADFRQHLSEQGDKAKPQLKMLDLYRQSVADMNSQAMGWLAPSGVMGQGGIFRIIAVQTGDAASMSVDQHSMLDLQTEISKATGDPNMQMSFDYTANAKQLDGVNFNQFKLNFNVGPNASLQSRQADRMIKMMYGPEGLIGLTGQVDSKHLLTGMGAGDDDLTHAIDAIKAGADPLGGLAELKDVTSNLPTQRIAAFYVPLDQIAMTVASYARQFGMQLNIQLAPHMAPVGVTIGTEQSAIRLDSFIPTQTVQSLIAAGMQAWMAAQGGGGGGL